ncbi:hypothetical protein FRC11_008724, partial [Ceratobasidium sp. 423]
GCCIRCGSTSHGISDYVAPDYLSELPEPTTEEGKGRVKKDPTALHPALTRVARNIRRSQSSPPMFIKEEEPEVPTSLEEVLDKHRRNHGVSTKRALILDDMEYEDENTPIRAAYARLSTPLEDLNEDAEDDNLADDEGDHLMEYPSLL